MPEPRRVQVEIEGADSWAITFSQISARTPNERGGSVARLSMDSLRDIFSCLNGRRAISKLALLLRQVTALVRPASGFATSATGNQSLHKKTAEPGYRGSAVGKVSGAWPEHLILTRLTRL